MMQSHKVIRNFLWNDICGCWCWSPEYVSLLPLHEWKQLALKVYLTVITIMVIIIPLGKISAYPSLWKAKMCQMKYEFAVLSKCVDITLQPFCKNNCPEFVTWVSKSLVCLYVISFLSIVFVWNVYLFIYFVLWLQHMTEAKSSQEACQLRMLQERSDSNIHSFPKGKTKNMPFLTCCGCSNLFPRVIFLLFVGLNE